MNIYFIKEKGNHKTTQECLQGFFVAPNESYLFDLNSNVECRDD